MHCEWKHIHPFHDEHVITASQHVKSEAGAAAFTDAALDSNHVVSAKPYERTGLTFERGEYHFTFDTFAHFHHVSRLRFYELGDDQAGSAVVKPATMFALTTLYTDLRGAVEVHGLHIPGLLDAASVARYLQTRFA